MKTSELFGKQFKIFLLVTYGIPYLMGIFMAFGYFSERDLSLFASVQMLCPAAGVIVAVITSHQHKELIPQRFFKVYLAMTVIGIVCAVTSVFALNKELNAIFPIIAMVGSISLLLTFLLDEDIKLKAFGILGISWKKVLPASVLFFVLLITRLFISCLLEGQVAAFNEILWNPQILFRLLITVPNFFLSFVFFFGEEYGWRYYLQPLLQKKFGAIKATLIMGFMWGIWHLPLNIFFYNKPEHAVYSIVTQLITCMVLGIYFAYFYMKTQNIWGPIFFHYLNNSFGSVLLGQYETSGGEKADAADILIFAAISFCVFGLFIFTKFYRDPKNRSETLEEQVAKFE